MLIQSNFTFDVNRCLSTRVSPTPTSWCACKGATSPPLALLYDRFGKAAYSVAYHVLQNSTLAEEATQDAFLKVWTQAHLWDANRGKPSTWLLTITRFTAIDRLRVENRRTAAHAVDLDDVLYTLGSVAPMDEPTWADERLAKSLLNRLSPEQRQVLELAYFRDMSHSEMAEHLAIPLGDDQRPRSCGAS
ncbi:MAG: sigma-70 family RNA polymerase sigma factor [Chloroflexi bacterium]|nr:sigma-70 family RNA polymerase sigma factor [Chloroflexota bacterium]